MNISTDDLLKKTGFSKSMEKQFNIAFAIDDSFAYPLAVALHSCLLNNKHLNIRIHLFSASLSESTISALEKLVKDYGQSFRFYRLDNGLFRDLPVNERISHATYYRILIPGLIDQDAENYLYLDADLIVTGDLLPLKNLDTGNKILAAVNDVAAIEAGMHHKHNVPDEFLYFNAGVLWINKRLWKESKATERVFEYLRDHSELCAFHDQDALNAVLYKERFPLSPLWNQQIGTYYMNRDVMVKAYGKDWEKEVRKPVVIHFNGQEKPWNKVSGHPETGRFRKYAREVEYFRYYEQFTLKKFVKKYLVYTLFGFSRVNRYYINKSKKKV